MHNKTPRVNETGDREVTFETEFLSDLTAQLLWIYWKMNILLILDNPLNVSSLYFAPKIHKKNTFYYT